MGATQAAPVVFVVDDDESVHAEDGRAFPGRSGDSGREAARRSAGDLTQRHGVGPDPPLADPAISPDIQSTYAASCAAIRCCQIGSNSARTFW
jgi:hypothetical protein